MSSAQLRIEGSKNSPPPFWCGLREGRIELKAPAFSTIRVRGRFGWRAVHQGRDWAREGILNHQPEVAISFPMTAKVTVSLAGQQWAISLLPPQVTRVSLRLFSNRVLAFVAVSLLLHAALVALSLRREKHTAGDATAKAPAQSQNAETKALAANGAEAVAMQPFAGMSYTRFFDRLIERTGTTAERLTHFLKKTGSFGAAMGGGKVAGSNSAAAGRVDVVGTAGGTALGDRVESSFQKSVPAAAAPKAKASGASDEAALRSRLSELKQSWQRAYSQALVADPKLALTVAYALKVGADGGLELVGFTPNGKFQPEALRILREGMTAALRGVRVDRKFAGATVRGENVFIH